MFDPEEDARLHRADMAAARRAVTLHGAHAAMHEARGTRVLQQMAYEDLMAASAQQAARDARTHLQHAQPATAWCSEQGRGADGTEGEQECEVLAAWVAHEEAWTQRVQPAAVSTSNTLTAQRAAASIPWPPCMEGMLEGMHAAEQALGKELGQACLQAPQVPAMRRVYLKASLRWHPDKWPGVDADTRARVSVIYAALAAQWHDWQAAQHDACAPK